MTHPDDVASLADFKRNTPRQLKELRRSGRPRVLTVAGKPRVVVQDAEAYEQLLEAVERAEAIAGVKRGMASFARGQGKPARQALSDALARSKRRTTKGRQSAA